MTEHSFYSRKKVPSRMFVLFLTVFKRYLLILSNCIWNFLLAWSQWTLKKMRPVSLVATWFLKAIGLSWTVWKNLGFATLKIFTVRDFSTLKENIVFCCHSNYADLNEVSWQFCHSDSCQNRVCFALPVNLTS